MHGVLPLAESKYTGPVLRDSECILGQSDVPAYNVQTPVDIMLAISYGWYEQRSDVLLGLHTMDAMYSLPLEQINAYHKCISLLYYVGFT